MPSLNSIVGVGLVVLGGLCILVALLIAIRKYVWPPGTTLLAVQGQPPDLTELIVKLLIAILKAPPALAFLVAGLILEGGGLWVLSAHPLVG